MTTDGEPLIPKLDSYDDRFVTIDPATLTLTVKHYLLTKPTLHVHIPSLLYIRPANEVVRRVELKPHGLSLNGSIFWARDWSRGGAIIGPRSGYEKSFVIKAKGDMFRSGFSVEDPAQFLKVMERLCPGVTGKVMGEQEEAEIWTETEHEASEGESQGDEE